jgi:hypothetical protein
MLTDWIYAAPIWLMGGVVIGIAVALSATGLLLVDRLFSSERRREHNDVAGFLIAVVGIFYAVLLASIAVMAWEDYSDARATIGREADLIADLHRIAGSLPAATGRPMQDALVEYAQVVVEEEWPALQRGERPRRAVEPLQRIQSQLVIYRPGTKAGEALLATMLSRLGDLYDARTDRLLAAADAIPPVVWWTVLLGAALTIGFTYFFGLQSRGTHLAMTGILAASLASVIVMTIALDRPFRGGSRLTPEPFLELLDLFVP